MPRKTSITDKPPIGVLIGSQLKNLGMEQKTLSKKIKISQTYMCAIINGRATPSIKLLKIIGDCLEINVSELVNAILKKEWGGDTVDMAFH